MKFKMEYLLFCRVCLQESSEMQSIFVPEECSNDTLMIYEKIVLCSSIKISHEENLPDNICSACLKDLHSAYNFRLKANESDRILKSFFLTNSTEINNQTPNVGKVKTEDDLQNNEKYTDSILELTPAEDNGVNVFVDDEQISTDAEDTNESNNRKIIKKDNVEMIQSNSNSLLNTDSILSYEYLSVENENLENENLGLNQFVVLKDKDIKVKKSKKLNEKNQRNKNQEEKRHKCEICGNKYKFNHSLQTHLRRHRNERPFACELCNKAFVLNVELKTHMRTHTGHKPYACHFCDRRFSDFGSRGKHERTHTGERPYVCMDCGKAFAYSYGLTGHMLIHTGEKPFGCEKCGKHFNKKHHLKNHLNMHLKNDNKDPNSINSKNKKTIVYDNGNTNSVQIFEEIVEEMVPSDVSEDDVKYFIIQDCFE